MNILREIYMNYTFIVKIIQWPLVLTSLCLLYEYESYEIAPWLWVVYCINSITYLVIVSVILINQIFVRFPKRFDFYCTIVGIPMYLIGTVGGVIEETVYEPRDAENGPNQLHLAVSYGVIALYMIVQMSLTIYFRNKQPSENPVIVESSANETPADPPPEEQPE